jgi:hypothetical protein
MSSLILLAQVISTWFLVGLIWTIQIVHYPLFAAVGVDRFVAYEASHTRLITLVVGPVMLVEAATAGLFVAMRPASIPAWIPWTGLGLVILIWISTAILQVPDHAKLANGFDAAAHAHLVGTNWLRTIAWTARGVILAVAIWPALRNVSGT